MKQTRKEMARFNFSWFWIILPIATIGLTLALFIVFIPGDCDDVYYYTGYFNYVKDRFHIVIDNDSWYISDWYAPNGDMPLDIVDYVNHTVRMKYAAGCGRRMVLDMKIV